MKIGFVDHHLNNYHANKFLSLLRGELAELGVEVVSAWESDPTGDDWCAKHGVARAESAIAVARASDAVIVLAPDNIDAHLALCREVFPAGKPTMVDKFLAPTLQEANLIHEDAVRHGVKLFSASGLRFAVELEAALVNLDGAPTEAFARGMGQWEGYGVHTLSLLFGILGPAAVRVLDTGNATNACVTLDFGATRGWAEVRAAENQWDVFPWQFGIRVGGRYITDTVKDFDGFYANLMRRAVHFFKTGESPVSSQEMLNTVAVLERARASQAAGGAWQTLD